MTGSQSGSQVTQGQGAASAPPMGGTLNLAHMPLAPEWLRYSEAFNSENPQIVRASVNMLISAWQGDPAGSIPSSFGSIARAAGLSEKEVGEHYAELTAGWQIEGTRLVHIKLNAVCESTNMGFEKILRQATMMHIIGAEAGAPSLERSSGTQTVPLTRQQRFGKNARGEL